MSQMGQMDGLDTMCHSDIPLNLTSAGTSLAEPSCSRLVETKPQTPLQFSVLPAELRHLIWDLTFTPRTLHINIREDKAPLDSFLSSVPRWNGSPPLTTTGVYFTAPDSLVKIPRPLQVQQDLYHHNQGQRYDHARHWTRRSEKRGLFPPGPVALYVCHDSRAFALGRYELAFAGTNLHPDAGKEFSEAWSQAGYSERRIWVNFEIDMIFITLNVTFACPLAVLSRYAREEVKKIKWLAFTDQSYQVSSAGGPVWMTDVPGGFGSFTNLKEIILYHLLFCHHAVSGPLWACPNVEEHIGGLEEAYLAALERQKQKNPQWTTDLPTVVARMGYSNGYMSYWR